MQRDRVALAPGNAKAAYASPLARGVAHIRTLLTERSDTRLAQLVAGKVFLVRMGSALLALVSQVLLARWMSTAIVVESMMFFRVAKRRLGLHIFILGSKRI